MNSKAAKTKRDLKQVGREQYLERAREQAEKAAIRVNNLERLAEFIDLNGPVFIEENRLMPEFGISRDTDLSTIGPMTAEYLRQFDLAMIASWDESSRRWSGCVLMKIAATVNAAIRYVAPEQQQ